MVRSASIVGPDVRKYSYRVLLLSGPSIPPFATLQAECWVKAKKGIGVQYSSKAFQALCRVHGIKQSMGSVGDCYDNAQAESWFATLKRESVLKTDRLKSAKELRQQVIRYIESWYNTRRLHTSLGNRSPVEYEAQLKKAQPEVTSALKGAGNLSNPNVSTKLG